MNSLQRQIEEEIESGLDLGYETASISCNMLSMVEGYREQIILNEYETPFCLTGI